MENLYTVEGMIKVKEFFQIRSRGARLGKCLLALFAHAGEGRGGEGVSK